MEPKFKVGDIIVIYNYDRDSNITFHDKIKELIPERDCPELGKCYLMKTYGYWNEKYIRKLTKLDKVLK